jgi:hypothetical protein
MHFPLRKSGPASFKTATCPKRKDGKTLLQDSDKKSAALDQRRIGTNSDPRVSLSVAPTGVELKLAALELQLNEAQATVGAGRSAR